MNCHVTDVHKPLAAVSKIVEKGNQVVFDKGGSYIENLNSGKRIYMQLEKGTYVIDANFEDDKETDKNAGFHRRA